MTNKNISPLYLYTKTAIESGTVNVKFLQKALDAVTNAVDSCCITPHKVTNSFLNTFYVLLNGMNKKVSMHKYEAVQVLLQNKIECCALENAG